ncbi:ShlB/FhaC/HecB family hemolysin secretion/activation protein [Rahnella aceris]
MEHTPDVQIQRPVLSGRDVHIPDEKPCFRIEKITLTGEAASDFQWALSSANQSGDPATGRCLGTHGINLTMRRIQNAIIARGYVTTRILAGQQDLNSGTLALRVIPGRISNIRYAEGSEIQGNALTLRSAIPLRSGDLLNLRDIEQALENLKRVPSADADIQIVPATEAGQSDLVVSYQRQFPLRLALTMDDAGSKATGRYQSGVSLSWDNPLMLNDLFYVGITHSFLDDSNPGDGEKGSVNYNTYYSIPFGFWQLSLSASQYDYHQTVPGYLSDYEYSGTSKNSDIRLSRLIYRDATRKLTLNVAGWARGSKNYVDDTEVEIQRRRTAGWETGISYHQNIGNALLDADLNWKQGTGAFNSLHAPEEEFNEGTSRPRILYADLQYNQPFALGPLHFRFSNQWRAQWNQTPLVPDDRFSIGNRYTVRGFDGEYTLSGDRGWLVRNDLGLALGHTQQEVYLGADYGEVHGPSTDWIIGHHLAGAVVGLRGGYKWLTYDTFTSWPMSKPDGMPVSSVTYGFSASLAF